MYVATTAPHLPAIPKPRYEAVAVSPWHPNPAVLESDRSDKPPWVRARSVSLETVRDFRARQLRTLMSVDDLVSKIFDRVGSLRERRRTLAIFLSDNGVYWGEHGLREKSLPYTEDVAVPFALRWPDTLIPVARPEKRHQRRHRTNDSRGRRSRTVDPDGRSLAPRSSSRHRVFTEHWGHLDRNPNWAALRTSRAQYVEYYSDDFSRIVFREYYRLRRDPWELQNVLHDGIRANNPNTGRLHRWIARYRSCAGLSCPGL